jgi:hypothetical protein
LHQAGGLVFDAGVDELQVEALGASGERERLVDLDATRTPAGAARLSRTLLVIKPRGL